MLGTRAVERRIGEKSEADCVHCGKAVKFKAIIKATQVIANVYDDNKWDRVEHFHSECYEDAGEPYGKPSAKLPQKVAKR